MSARQFKYTFRTGNIINTNGQAFEKSDQELLTSLQQSINGTPLSGLKPKQAGLPGSDNENLNGCAGEVAQLSSPPPTSGALIEERHEYDITVKLFYLPAALARDTGPEASAAVHCVLKELAVDDIDLLIISLPSISFGADDDSSDTEPSEMEVSEWLRAYSPAEDLVFQKKVKRLGVAEFGTARLAKLLPRIRVKPKVDQINVKDCCVVPKPLIHFARSEDIDLFTHNDCTNILPQTALTDILKSSDVFSGFQSVEPQWVIKYTAVIRDRGVVESKGSVWTSQQKETPAIFTITC